jgi:polyisoprenoid-binding protein YceI
MKPLLCALALTLAACSPPAQEAEKVPAPAEKRVVSDAPAGSYTMDKAHTSVNFRVSHLGFSNYTARFTDMDGTLTIDPAHPEQAVLVATIDARSLQTNDKATEYDFDKELTGPDWLDAAKHPQITFRSTKVEMTGPNTANVTGDFTLHGVTKPVVLETRFNGGYGNFPMDPGGARIGFSAHGTLKRSDFGIAYGIPPAGSNMGVSDEVEVIIETEFQKHDAQAKASA